MTKWSQKRGVLPQKEQDEEDVAARLRAVFAELGGAVKSVTVRLGSYKPQVEELQTHTSGTSSIAPEQSPPSAGLIERQYELARQHPGEYVILDGPEILFHSRDRHEALAEYRRLAAERRGGDPRLIRPDASFPPPAPRVRGRSVPNE